MPTHDKKVSQKMLSKIRNFFFQNLKLGAKKCNFEFSRKNIKIFSKIRELEK